MKILFLLLSLISLSFSKTYIGTYKISYGVLGELGVAKTYLTMNNNKYEIKINAYATGLAKFLSNERKETYVSKGEIKDNILVPIEYFTQTKNLYKTKSKTYIFDNDNKNILLKTYSKRVNTKLNNELKQVKYWNESMTTEKNEFYANNDILSLFFNINKLIKDYQTPKKYTYYAVGAKEENGNLDIFIPTQKKSKIINKLLKTKDKKIIVNLNQKIFSSDKGELFISLRKDGFSNKAILKDVLLFGDIIGELISFEIKE